jgi:predicted HicB family RNase H-like nuclease
MIARLLFALIVVWCSVADAYVLPTGFLLGKAAEKRSALNLNELDVFLQTTDPNGDIVDEKLLLKRSARLRWTRTTNEGEAVRIVKDNEQATVRPDGRVVRERVEVEPFSELLLPKGQSTETVKSEYLTLCQRLGIETSRTTLARFNSRVAIVIGAGGKDKDRPQLWIDKDAFYPVRLLYRGEYEGKKGMWDIQLREFGARETGELFPRVVERHFDGKLLSHSEVEKVTSTTKISEASFQLPAAK